MESQLIFSPSPHLHTHRSTNMLMRHVLIALLPAIACSLYYFGIPALITLVVSCLSCVGIEWAITRYMLHRPTSISDGTALLTGVLLALNLPANLPWWMTVAGAVMAIGIAKMAFGGLGCNIFNPALVGRVFLLISFPVAMTTWPLPEAGFGDADGATGATMLSLIKLNQLVPTDANISDMLLGNIGGSMGEVSAIAILIGFVYLLITRVISFEIPLSIIVGVIVIDLFAGYPIVVDLLTGGLLLGAVFMATDYVTSPMTRKGMVIYGVMIGIITASIRRWGAYPEGMSFAILIMNGCVPLLDRWFKPSRFAKARKEAKA